MPDGAVPDLFQRAERVGVWCWCERRLFEVLGSWAGTTAEPDVAVFFGEMSRRHGWHAELLFDRLPELSALDAASLVVSPGAATSALFDGLDGRDGVDAGDGPSAARRLVAVHRVVLPLLITQYRSAITSVSTVAEPSLARWLDIVVRDDLDEWTRAQALLARYLVDDASVRAAAGHQLDVELAALATESLTR
jgi:hypothetical protein